MDSTIVSVLITGLLALASNLAGSYFANRKSAALIAYRLEQLESKVQAHNNLVERMYQLEERATTLERALEAHEVLAEEKIKVANHRINDLESAANR